MASSHSSSVPTDFSGPAGGELRSKSSKPKARSTEHEVEQAAHLVAHLLGRAEDVGVVLGEAPDAHEAVDDAGLLVAVHGAELEEPQRQLPVAALARLEDQVVERAVHRLRVVVLALGPPSSSISMGGYMPSAYKSRCPEVSNSSALAMWGV